MLRPARISTLLGLTLVAAGLSPVAVAAASPVPAVLLEQIVTTANDQVHLASSTNGDSFTFGPSTSQAGGVKLTSGTMTMQIAPAPGTQLSSNTDLVASNGTGTRPYASMTITGLGAATFTCVNVAVHIAEVDRDGTGAITAFAAS